MTINYLCSRYGSCGNGHSPNNLGDNCIQNFAFGEVYRRI